MEQSPRIERLRADLQRGDDCALETFWNDVAQHGAPLVEPTANDPRHVLVTFVWRGDPHMHNVVVFGGFAHWDFARSHLERLEDSDVWYRTYRSQADARMVYRFSPNDNGVAWYDARDWDARVASWQTDPLNPRTVTDWRPGSLLELPDAPAPRWLASDPMLSTGRVDVVTSWASARLGNARNLWVYTPAPSPQSNEPPCLLVVFDGWSYVHLTPTPTILDTLIAQRVIPPTVAVFVDHIDRGRELVGGTPFFAMLTDELLPWLHDRYHITSDPQRSVVAGSSAGGFAALYAAIHHPQHFGNVLAQSGAFAWKPDDEDEYEWLARQFVNRPQLPLRAYLDVGCYDCTRIAHHSPTILEANRHLRNVLKARGYDVTYREYSGAHDYLGWSATFGDGLIALLGYEKHTTLDALR